jgi:hypothetical protein
VVDVGLAVTTGPTVLESPAEGDQTTEAIVETDKVVEEPTHMPGAETGKIYGNGCTETGTTFQFTQPFPSVPVTV